MYDSYESTIMAAMGIYVVVILAIAVFAIVCMWKIFTKAGQPGWASIIPFYNYYVLFEIAWGNGLLFLLLLIPVANFVVMIILWVKLSQSFGYSAAFAIGLLFLPIIFLPILAFGSSRYIGPQ